LVQILKSFGHVATSRATGDLNRDLTTGLADLAIAQRGFAPSPAPSPVASNASRDEDSTILRTNAARRSTSIRPVRRAILHDLALVSIESARPDEAESPRALRSLIRRR
jgi:hypothetical protein